MSFFIKDDGTIDFERTTPATVEQLRKAVTHPEAQRQLGFVNDAGAPTPPRTWSNMTTTLVDAVNAILVQAAVNTWRLTEDQARFLLLRNDPPVVVNGQQLPSTHEQVTALTGELLDKYFPGGFGEYDKEISLLLLLAGFTANAVQRIRKLNPSPREVTHFPSTAAVQ